MTGHLWRWRSVYYATSASRERPAGAAVVAVGTRGVGAPPPHTVVTGGPAGTRAHGEARFRMCCGERPLEGRRRRLARARLLSCRVPPAAPRRRRSSALHAADSESAPYGNVAYIWDAPPAAGTSVHPACNMKVRASARRPRIGPPPAGGGSVASVLVWTVRPDPAEFA